MNELKELYNTKFNTLYHNFLLNKEMSDKELEKLVAIAILLCNKNNILFELGYRIILLYSLRYSNFSPLYEVSLNKGFIPIAQFIMNKHFKKKNIFIEFNDILNNEFKFNENHYFTKQQKEMNNNVYQEMYNSQIIVAPTSYGKTELFKKIINEQKYKKICILSPTKSLIAQTRNRIKNYTNEKIIIHPDMFHGEESFIAIMTQERVLKLMQMNPQLSFDLLIIDEAHNILNKDERNILLASVIILCNNRNKELKNKFFSPFIQSENSMQFMLMNNDFKFFSISEKLKSEQFYYYDIKEGFRYIVDQFAPSNNILKDKEIKSDAIDIIEEEKAYKNIVYLNGPKKIEDFSKKLLSRSKLIKNDTLLKIANDIRNYIHPDYLLAECIEHGFIYHHAFIPDAIRYYLEDVYTNIFDIDIIIASSTLLEGVNIPATKMFILDPYKGKKYLTNTDFNNLIGRICRFSDIFDNRGDLHYLVPEIYFINDEYFPKKFNFKKFVNTKILKNHKDLKDDIQNPLLENNKATQEERDKARMNIENISPSDTLTRDYKLKPITQIGKLCFENGIKFFDILKIEELLDRIINDLKKDNNTEFDDIEKVWNIICKLFFNNIDEKKDIYNLRDTKTQNFYLMLLRWKINQKDMHFMINSMVNYWKKRNENMIYVGKWGDTPKGENGNKYWIDKKKKTNKELNNIAIVKIIEEFNFIDNEILKFFDILKSLNLININLYNLIKYGTSNENEIKMLEYGLSSNLIKLLDKKYSKFYKIKDNFEIDFFPQLVSEMEKNHENGIYITEIKMNLTNKP